MLAGEAVEGSDEADGGVQPLAVVVATKAATWRSYGCDELVQRDKCSLDLFWFKDHSLLHAWNLPEPDTLAAENAEELRSPLAQVEEMLGDLGGVG